MLTQDQIRQVNHFLRWELTVPQIVAKLGLPESAVAELATQWQARRRLCLQGFHDYRQTEYESVTGGAHRIYGRCVCGLSQEDMTSDFWTEE